MKSKTPRTPGVKIEEFEIVIKAEEILKEAETKEVPIESGTPGQEQLFDIEIVKEAVIKPADVIKCKIQYPGFQEFMMGHEVLVANQNALVRAGKIIFDTCAIEYDDKFDLPNNSNLLVRLCMKIASHYYPDLLSDVDKKKAGIS